MSNIEQSNSTYTPESHEQNNENLNNPEKKQEYTPVQVDPITQKVELEEKKWADEELIKQLESMEEPTQLWQAVDKLIKWIQYDETLNDPAWWNIVDHIIESVKSWNRTDALKNAYDFLMNVFGGGWGKWVDFFWFNNNKQIHEFINDLNTNNYSLAQLESKKQVLMDNINNTSGIKKKIWMTYALSHLLDHIVYSKYPEKSRMKWSSNNNSNKTYTQCSIARMAQQVQPWDIIALNKSEQGTWDRLLTELTTGDLDASHVVIVTGVDPQSWTITIAHSTMNRLSQPGTKWVETNISLEHYANQFNGLAMVALNPPAEVDRKQLVENVIAKNNMPYDSFSAASEWVLKTNIASNNGKYNCAELIAESFGDHVSAKMRQRSHPAQMVASLQPKYVSLGWKSMAGS